MKKVVPMVTCYEVKPAITYHLMAQKGIAAFAHLVKIYLHVSKRQMALPDGNVTPYSLPRFCLLFSADGKRRV